MSSINLLTHQADLKDAWEEVLDENRPTNWALFGYDGQTYNLKLVSKGDGGLDELKDEFMPSEIMYAFCRVTIPVSGVKRNVLINWQGEGAPVVRKGCCANHLPEVGRFFRGYQLIIHARYDDEVESDTIIEQLIKCCAAAGIQRTPESMSDSSGEPVASVYKKVQPQKDVTSMSEREQFWQKEQEEEKRRERDEKKSIDEKRKRDAENSRQRDLEASKMREAKYLQDNGKDKAPKEAPAKRIIAAPVKKLDTSMWEKQIKEAEQNGKPAVPQPLSAADKKRGGINDARAIFEGKKKPENALPDVVPIKTSTEPASMKPGKIVIPNFEEKAEEKVEKSVGKLPEIKKSEGDMQKETQPAQKDTFPTGQNLLAMKQQESVDENNGQNDEEQDWEQEPLEEPPTKIPDPLVDAMLEQGIIAPIPASKANTISADSEPEPVAAPTEPVDKGQCARALYDYKAADETEISFDPEDIITNIDQIDEGWWQGVGPDGTFGLFPANYVALI